MTFRARCPHCQAQVTAPEGALGRKLHCPRCREEFMVSHEASAPVLPAAPAAPMTWEYRVEDVIEPAPDGKSKPDQVQKASALLVEKRLNVLGAEGWELAAASYYPAEAHGLTDLIGFWKMILKRPGHGA